MKAHGSRQDRAEQLALGRLRDHEIGAQRDVLQLPRLIPLHDQGGKCRFRREPVGTQPVAPQPMVRPDQVAAVAVFQKRGRLSGIAQ